MAKTTFGQEFQRLQREKGFTNEQLAEKMYDAPNNNGAVVTRLRKSKLPERDKRLTAETVQMACEAMKLTYYEQILLYGLAKLIPVMPMPAFSQVESALKNVAGEIKQHPYIAYVLDRVNYRFWLINAATVKLIGGQERVDALKNCSVFDLVYDPRHGLTQMFDGLEYLQRLQVARFKAVNVFHQHEPFFMGYPEAMECALPKEAYQAFRTHWNEMKGDESMVQNHDVTFKIAGATLSFRIVTESIWTLGGLYHAVRYMPYSEEDAACYNKLFSGLEPEVIYVWELEGAKHRESIGI